ncbi:MAG: discoidin domain-containing protein [Chitinispirillales bacterium]|jgi:hypothetical protein|nr:discoidin domain-containing protein [Chitinispirillales bacterium]
MKCSAVIQARNAAAILICAFSLLFAQPGQITIVVNNVGYEKSGTKRAIVQSVYNITATTAEVISEQSGVGVVHTITLGEESTVSQWSGDGFRYFKVADFSAFNQVGDGYRVRVGTAASPPFSIGEKLLQTRTGADQVNFFKTMRNTDDSDRALPVFGTNRTHNIYGGWWDATGDPGKHLSHLTYSNYLTPQQIPLVVWALLHANEAQPAAFGAAALEEAAWGADYLLRSLDSEGFFYLSVFDNWGDGYRWVDASAHGSGTRGAREICNWGNLSGIDSSALPNNPPNSNGIRSNTYQSAMREGAGVSIAALARAYKAGISSGDSSAAQYLAGAVRAYAHLKSNPTKYQDDGKENIIDDYTGLLAATELYIATGENQYRVDARARVESLLNRQSSNGWFYSGTDNNGDNIRPFYHAAEEGFPVVALSRYYQTAANSYEKIELRAAIRKNLLSYHNITYESGSNPFEYAKMYRAESGETSGGPLGDLARGKTVTASREEASYTASNAVDGSSTTRWSSYQNGSQNDSQWIAVDLGKTYMVNRAVLNWEGAFGRHYRIDVSTNGTTWTPAFTITNNTAVGRVEHTFTAVQAKHVRMFGIERGFEHGGFSLWDFEVYGDEIDDGPAVPSPYQARFFIPKQNETGYWWQGENARLASMASALILGAPMADSIGTTDAGNMWRDTLFTMATAQLDWILGRNPLNLCMMYGHGPNKGGEYVHYSRAARYIPNIKGGICNGITSMFVNENNIEFAPHDPNGERWFMNWRYVEQWLPHNAWYLIAVSSLSYRIENEIEPEVISVKVKRNVNAYRLKISAARNRSINVTLPFKADNNTEIALYNIRGQRLFSSVFKKDSYSTTIKLSSRLAAGTYVVDVKDRTRGSVVTSKFVVR